MDDHRDLTKVVLQPHRRSEASPPPPMTPPPPPCCAPQMLRNRHNPHAPHAPSQCDIFSLGISLYQICLSTQLPANGQGWLDIRAGNLIEIGGNPLLAELIRSMMMVRCIHAAPPSPFPARAATPPRPQCQGR